MLSTWATNVLKVGVAPKFFSIEDYAADIDQARLFYRLFSFHYGYFPRT